ncbi:MAG: D-alanine--D-alanine ligase family protein [Tissierellia bacterium]|nr:D-alanine--D-alanine ligase family protein [Tissierellia bacterium]
MIKCYLLCGGPSTEHDISLRSARNISENLDKNKYDLKIVYIDKKGHFSKPFEYESNEDEFNLVKKTHENKFESIKNFTDDIDDLENTIVIPAIHGIYGEDGKIEGFLDVLGLKYIGNGVLSSAICMDKETTNDILKAKGFKQANYLSVNRLTDNEEFYEKCEKELHFPIIVKPSANGSSIGVNRANDKDELEKYIKEALKYDKKALCEQEIMGQEIEISVMGNENPKTSRPGAYTTTRALLDYEAKYLDQKTVEKVPYEMDIDVEKRAREIAKKAYMATNCEGFARVDIFYVANENEFYVNEINTFPGLTPSSFYARLWEVTENMSFSEVLDRLIELGFEKYEVNND